MGKLATGTEIVFVGGVASCRVRVQGKRETFQFPTAKDAAEALERRAQVIELERRMRGVDRELALAGLRRTAAAKAGQTLRAACANVDKLIGGWRPSVSDCPTLAEFAERWLSGELARTYVDDVRVKQNTGPARANLEKYIFPTLGKIPLDAITLDACNEIKHSLGHLRSNSRRQVLAPLKVLLDYAVYPCRLIERSPLPNKWLPKEGDTRSLCWLYPSEEAQLMACVDVPLWFRVLVGYLIREGGRVNEPCAQSVGQFDFREGRNTASLTKAQTKTRKARMWVMDAGTARALTRWVALRGATAADYMFVNAEGRKVNTKTIDLPALLRASLKRAGVDRAELFTLGAEERHICIHDTRRTFVTVKLSLGWSEAEVSARTGHLTSNELRGYQETANTFRELATGDFLPLDVAIPELRCALVSDDQPVTSAIANLSKPFDSHHSMVEQPPASQVFETAKDHTISACPGSTFPTISGVAGHSAAEAAARIAELEAKLAALTSALGGVLRTVQG